METPIVNLDSIDAYNNLYGLQGSHRLVEVIDLKKATKSVNHIRVNYGVYALYLKNGARCSIKYGRRQYDCQEGTVVSFSPGQMVDVHVTENDFAPDVVGLMFHPDLIYGTPLADRITDFHFFDYSEMEALHLSENERAVFLHCLELIERELSYPADNHSTMLLTSNIMILLEYLQRFYDRQFITRHKVNSNVVARFHRELKLYYSRDGETRIFPTVAYFADKANLSAGYFSDLVKKETGLVPKEIITNQIISHAKRLLAAGDRDISQIAYDLGFDYPSHFSRTFKRATGQSPSEFKSAIKAL